MPARSPPKSKAGRKSPPKSKSKASRNVKKQPTKKAPATAYNVFCKEQRELVKAALGKEATPKEVSKKLGEEWRALPNSIKKEYKLEEKKQKEELQAGRSVWQAKQEKATGQQSQYTPRKSPKKPKKLQADMTMDSLLQLRRKRTAGAFENLPDAAAPVAKAAKVEIVPVDEPEKRLSDPTSEEPSSPGRSAKRWTGRSPESDANRPSPDRWQPSPPKAGRTSGGSYGSVESLDAPLEAGDAATP